MNGVLVAIILCLNYVVFCYIYLGALCLIIHYITSSDHVVNCYYRTIRLDLL